MIAKMTPRRQIISQILAISVLTRRDFPGLLDRVHVHRSTRRLRGRPASSRPAHRLKAYAKVFATPTPNPVTFPELARRARSSRSRVSGPDPLLIGTTAAYAFSRFRFPGRQVGMLGFIIVLMLPAVATVTALFVLLNFRPRATVA